MAKKRILIAEDEKPIARALKLKFNSSGFEAKVVNNGEEAVIELSKNNYDLLLLDIMMPIKDGFGVLEDVKNKKIDIKIIVSSNLSQYEDIDKARSMGAMGYFVKSNTSINEVIAQVKTALSIT